MDQDLVALRPRNSRPTRSTRTAKDNITRARLNETSYPPPASPWPITGLFATHPQLGYHAYRPSSNAPPPAGALGPVLPSSARITPGFQNILRPPRPWLSARMTLCNQA